MTSLESPVAERQREQWVDRLRVTVIAGVIVVHAATGYVVDVGWYYDDERDTTEPWSVLLSVPTLVGGVFGLGPLFLLAGWFSARSLARRGPRGFLAARLLRLGVPVLLYLLFLQPLTDYVGNLRDERASFWHYLRTTELGVMWFVAALVAFTGAHAALRGLRPPAGPGPPLGSGALLGAALTIAVGSCAVWQVSPWGAETFMNLRFGEWPQAAVLYVLGVRAGEAGSLDLAARQVRFLRTTALAGMVALLALVLVQGARDQVDALLEEASPAWAVLLFAAIDGALALSGTLWLIDWFRRRRSAGTALLSRAGRASYATYIVHPLVLTTLMLLFGPVGLAAQLKFVVVAAVAVPLCFAAGYALTRLPGTSSVL